MSGAAAIRPFSKDEQRAAAAAVLSRKAGTLQAAANKQRAEQEAADGGVPGLPYLDQEERPAPKRLRRVAKRFMEQCDTLLKFIDAAALDCGGPNDYTRRMRQKVAVLQRIMQACSHDFGRSVRTAPPS